MVRQCQMCVLTFNSGLPDEARSWNNPSRMPSILSKNVAQFPFSEFTSATSLYLLTWLRAARARASNAYRLQIFAFDESPLCVRYKMETIWVSFCIRRMAHNGAWKEGLISTRLPPYRAFSLPIRDVTTCIAQEIPSVKAMVYFGAV